MNKFTTVAAASNKMGESNDCSVKAVSIACRVPYNKAHDALKAEGRQTRRGARPTQILRSVEALGCVHEGIINPRQPNGSRYTMSTIGKLCKRGYWMALVNGHIAAVVNGQVEDWTEGRRHQVLAVWKVSVPRGSRSK
jgi:hypothetical protein